MQALKVIIPIYVILFILYGTKDFKKFLLLTGIISMPFPTLYSLIYYPHRGWTDGIIIRLPDVSFIILFFYLIIKKTDFSKASKKITFPVIFFVISIAFSLLNSTMGRITILQMLMILKVFFLYYYVFVNSIDSEKDLQDIVLFLSLSLLLQSVYACTQTLFGFHTEILRSDDYRPEILSMVSGAARAFGTTGHPNAFASYITPLIIINLTLYLTLTSLKKFRLLLIAFSLFALIFSASRNGWLSFTIASFFLLAVGMRRNLIKSNYVIAFIIIMMIAIISVYPVLHDRLTRSDHGSAASRIPLMKLALNMIVAHPVIGVGGNTFQNVTRDYISPDLQGMFVTIVHNQYLLVAAECGLIGLCAWLWIMLSIFKEALKCATSKTSPFISSLGMGVAIGFISVSIFMMSDMHKSELDIGMMFILGGLSSIGRQIESAIEY